MVLYYSADQSTQAITDITHQRMKQLKESLAQVLTLFYPFAGRVKDKVTIDCNDEGVHYTETKVSHSLSEFFSQPNFSSLICKLLPNQAIMEVSAEGYTNMVKVTCFACGSMVVGTLISHMIADGACASFFLSSWGSNSRLGGFHTPFPQNNTCPQATNAMHLCGQFLKKGMVAARRFLFDADSISRLRAHGLSSTTQNPTQVEVVASLLSKCVAKASKKVNSGLERPTLITHAVNMRRRASPNFPNSCMGNFAWLATAQLSADYELPELVTKFREAVTSINSDFVKSFQGEGGFAKYCESAKQVTELASRIAPITTSGVNYLHCSSWCHFGLYDVDFGWGKPVWVSCVAGSLDDDGEGQFFNSIILMDTPSEKGIEV
ncbi:hypothetical protein Fmac_027560 [Flemingia macrophylla]|uniref:Vinorine synthase-like n=1 Tax=Flemingia macrophylla TaxID=520843 RepID=A0ABD1LIA0_9FABA